MPARVWEAPTAQRYKGLNRKGEGSIVEAVFASRLGKRVHILIGLAVQVLPGLKMNAF
jgi:hypothetical protein